MSSLVDTSSSVCDALDDERLDDGDDGFITDVASDSDDDLVDQVAVEGGRRRREGGSRSADGNDEMTMSPLIRDVQKGRGKGVTYGDVNAGSCLVSPSLFCVYGYLRVYVVRGGTGADAMRRGRDCTYGAARAPTCSNAASTSRLLGEGVSNLGWPPD